MNLIIKINLDNDAFQEGYGELGRILIELGKKVEATVGYTDLSERKIFDLNGNSVGTLKLEE